MPKAPIVKPLTDNQLAVIALLQEALEQAQQGEIHTIGVIACMEGGFGAVMAGSRAGDLHLGCSYLQAKILAAVTDPEANKPAARVKLIKGLGG